MSEISMPVDVFARLSENNRELGKLRRDNKALLEALRTIAQADAGTLNHQSACAIIQACRLLATNTLEKVEAKS